MTAWRWSCWNGKIFLHPQQVADIRNCLCMKWNLWLAAFAVICVAGCASIGTPDPLPTVAQVNLDRYTGTWYEVARLPTPFQKDQERAIARYTPMGDSQVAIRNTGIMPDGSTRTATGVGTPVEGSNNSKLRITFNEFPASLMPAAEEGNYWILALDTEYRYAMVGTPDRDFLWLLSRDKTMPDQVKSRYVTQAQSLGFDTSKLLSY